MRKCTAFVTTIFLLTDLFAQEGIDSLRQLLVYTKEDTVRVNLLNRIAENYPLLNPDSTYKYGNDALVLSREINYRKGEAEAIRNLATAFTFTGDFSRGLEYSLDALK